MRFSLETPGTSCVKGHGRTYLCACPGASSPRPSLFGLPAWRDPSGGYRCLSGSRIRGSGACYPHGRTADDRRGLFHLEPPGNPMDFTTQWPRSGRASTSSYPKTRISCIGCKPSGQNRYVKSSPCLPRFLIAICPGNSDSPSSPKTLLPGTVADSVLDFFSGGGPRQI